jgi:hypothetical protein
MEKLAEDAQFSLLQKFANYGIQGFVTLVPGHGIDHIAERMQSVGRSWRI